MQESNSLYRIHGVEVDVILEDREVGLNRAMSDLSGVVKEMAAQWQKEE